MVRLPCEVCGEDVRKCAAHGLGFQPKTGMSFAFEGCAQLQAGLSSVVSRVQVNCLLGTVAPGEAYSCLM